MSTGVENQKDMLAVLLVEDNPGDARLIREMLRDTGRRPVELACAATLEAALGVLGGEPVEAVLLDLSLPDSTGLATVERVREAAPELPIIVLTGLEDERFAKRALRKGAQDYLVKGRVDEDGLRRSLRYAIERRKAEGELARLHRRHALILESAGEGILGLDLEGRATFVNPAAAAMLGYSPDELAGEPVDALLHHPEANGSPISAHASPIWASLQAGSAIHVADAVLWRRDGTSLTVAYTTTPIKENGTVSGAVVTLQDITDRKRLEAQLAHWADHDALTDLANRRALVRELDERELPRAKRSGRPGALVYLDLDRFKEVNDRFGHRAGDQLLVSVAKLLRSELRKSDLIARLGGEEFAVVLPETDTRHAELAAERLLESLRRHTVCVDRRPIRVTASAGVALFPEHGETAEELLERADRALYQAKSLGRDQYRFYRPGKTATGHGSRPMCPDRIHEAMERDRFRLYGQSIVSLRSARVALYEILLRLEDDRGRLIPPGAFLDVAERSGQIRQIDRWVVRQALDLLRRAHLHGDGLSLAVNLSGRSLSDSDLLIEIQAGLSAAPALGEHLVFDITETSAIADLCQARSLISSLRSLGCRFALDDFGVSFASFTHLKHLPVDFLKIDGDFVRELAGDPASQELVRAMAGVARRLGMQTIAEHVEDRRTMELLSEYGVDYAQGYHLGRPAPVSEVMETTCAAIPAAATTVADR